MARDLTVAVREFVVAALAAAAPIIAIAGPRVYGPSVPANPGWPFIRVDLPVVNPEPDGCANASRYTFNVHGFAKGLDERAAASLGAAVSAFLDELSGVIVVAPEAVITDTVWTATQVFRDTATTDGWHAVVSIYCRVSG